MAVGNGKCRFCEAKVAGNGDRCGQPAPGEKYSAKCSRRGVFGDHRRKSRKNKRKSAEGTLAVKRGIAVAGVRKRNASSKEPRNTLHHLLFDLFNLLG